METKFSNEASPTSFIYIFELAGKYVVFYPHKNIRKIYGNKERAFLHAKKYSEEARMPIYINLTSERKIQKLDLKVLKVIDSTQRAFIQRSQKSRKLAING